MITTHTLSNGLPVTCCCEGGELYDAWLAELSHASDLALDTHGLPWNSVSIFAAMRAYFTHRNGCKGGRDWPTLPKCCACGYGVTP